MSLIEQKASGFRLAQIWTERRYRSVLFQLLALFALVALVAFVANNTIENLRALGVSYGFDFLGQPSNYDINQRLIEYDSTSTHGRAAVVGLLNTLLVAVFGVILATLLGFTIGILRLSNNWLVARLATVYIESLRNVPVLLQILLWHGIILGLPRIVDAMNFRDTVYLSNRGLAFPRPLFEPAFWFVVLAFAAGVGVAVFLSRRARRLQEQTGKITPVFWINTGLVIGLPIVVYVVTGFPVAWELPEMGRFNLRGGIALRPEFVALWLALSFYTAAFIAEIVRSGIQAISHGQTEAAYSLGLRPGRTLRLIIIPQALRIIVPPLTSQYLNLTKNSSLAAAIAYPDIVLVFAGTVLMQTGQAVEIIAITMGFYLAVSLIIAGVMNWYNKKMALVER